MRIILNEELAYHDSLNLTLEMKYLKIYANFCLGKEIK